MKIRTHGRLAVIVAAVTLGACVELPPADVTGGWDAVAHVNDARLAQIHGAPLHTLKDYLYAAQPGRASVDEQLRGAMDTERVSALSSPTMNSLLMNPLMQNIMPLRVQGRW